MTKYGVMLGAMLTVAICATAWPAGELVVTQARATASIPGTSTSSIFLTLHNAGAASDRLLGASSPVAQQVQMHGTVISNGVAMMRPLEGVDISVGSVVEFKSGGNHLMLVGIKSPLVAGTTVPLVLKFQRAGELRLNIPVVPVGLR